MKTAAVTLSFPATASAPLSDAQTTQILRKPEAYEAVAIAAVTNPGVREALQAAARHLENMPVLDDSGEALNGESNALEGVTAVFLSKTDHTLVGYLVEGGGTANDPDAFVPASWTVTIGVSANAKTLFVDNEFFPAE